MHTTILLSTKLTCKPLFSFLTQTLLTCTEMLHQAWMPDPGEVTWSKHCMDGWAAKRSCPTFLDPIFNCNSIILWKWALGCCAFHQHSSGRSLGRKKKRRGEKTHNTSCCKSFFFPRSWPCQLQVSFKTAPAVPLSMTLLEQLLCLRNMCCLGSLHLFFILDQAE